MEPKDPRKQYEHPPDLHLGREDAAMTYDPGASDSPDSPFEKAFAELESKILDVDGIEGLARGLDEAGAPVIVVFLRTADSGLNLPSSIRGFQIRKETTGPISAG